MKTLFILMSCCHYRRPINSANWQPVVDAIPCICWGIIMLIALYLILKLIVLPLIKNCHEMKMKDEAFTQEKHWYDEKKKASDEDLNRKIREYNELTIHQRILDKVTGTDKDKEIETLKKGFEDLKKKYESLDGEIEQIIIKKKQ